VPTLRAKVQLCPRDYKGRFNVKVCAWVGDYIVVAVEGPNALYCVDLNSLKIVSTFNCPSVPSSVRCSKDQVIVCLPETGQLLVCKLANATLKLVKLVNIIIPSKDMLCISDFKIVSYQDRNLNQLTVAKTGQWVNQIHLEEVCCGSYRNNHYFDFNLTTGVIYISCFEQKKLLALGGHGNIIFKYRHANLHYPCSPTVDSDGNIYIPSTGQSSHSIHQINNKGEHIRELLCGEVVLPWCISFHSSITKFAVTDNSPDAQLKIYAFQ